jgi:hypothetical protein
MFAMRDLSETIATDKGSPRSDAYGPSQIDLSTLGATLGTKQIDLWTGLDCNRERPRFKNNPNA